MSLSLKWCKTITGKVSCLPSKSTWVILDSMVRGFTSEMGRKDVVFIRPQETVRFIAKFDNFSDSITPYMYHCHLLTHEDGGMMGQFVVVENLEVADIFTPNRIKFTLYPNPASDYLNINFNKIVNLESISIYDVRGARVYFEEYFEPAREYKLNYDLSAGYYRVHVNADTEHFIKKLLINNWGKLHPYY